MITLFHAPKSRSGRVIWLLEELGAPYEIRVVDIRRGNGTGKLDEANPHPHGKVPAIRDGSAVIFESAAIMLYLTDAFPAAGLGPKVGDPERGRFLTLLSYYAGVMEPAFLSKIQNTPVPRGTAGWVVAEEAMGFIQGELKKGDYLLGQRFSAADVLYGSTFALFAGSPMLPMTPELDAYIKRCTQRPAYGRAQARDEG